MVSRRAAKRFDIFLVSLDPTVGTEIRKTRPCVVLSPDEMNAHVHTVIIAPMTSKGGDYPWRVPTDFNGKAGQVVIDQLRSVDSRRLKKRIGTLDEATQGALLSTLAEMFAP